LTGYGLTCGETWSPGPGKNQTLVRLAEGLRAHTEQPSAETVALLRSLIEPAGKNTRSQE